MPFDYNAFQTKCDGLSTAELQKEWENYTRQIAGGATSTAGAILFSPLTAGVSLVGLGLSAPRIHNARKKREIIEASLRNRGATHQTRKRDVLAPMAVSGGLGVLTLDLAGPGADLIAGEAVGKGVEYAAAQVVLDGAAATAEHVHTNHEKKEAMEKLRREQQMRMGVPMIQPYQQKYMQQQPMQPQMYQYQVPSQQHQFQQYIQQSPQLNAYPQLQPQQQQYQQYQPQMPERQQTELTAYLAPVGQYPLQPESPYPFEKDTYVPQPPQTELPQYQPAQQDAAPQIAAYKPAAHQQQYQPIEQATRRYSYQADPPAYQQFAQNPLARVQQARRPVSMVFPAQPSAPAPINDQKSPQFEIKIQNSIAPQFADRAAQLPKQSELSVGYSERDGEAFCQVQQQREPAAPQISQDEKREQPSNQNQQYQQAWQEQSQQQAQQEQQAQETEQDQLEQQLQQLKLDQQLQHEKQQKPEQEQEQEQEPEEQLQQRKNWQSAQEQQREQQLQQIQQLQQAIQEQQAIIQQQQQRRQSYLPQQPASAQTYPEPAPPNHPISPSLPTYQYTQQQQPAQQPQKPQQNPQQFYQPQPQRYHPQLSPAPLSFNNAQTQPIYQPPHHLRHNSTVSTVSNFSTRPCSVASILPPYSTPSSTPGYATTPYFPPPPKYASLSAASSTAKPYAPGDYFSQGGYAPQQQVVGGGVEPDYGAPPPPPAAWR